MLATNQQAISYGDRGGNYVLAKVIFREDFEFVINPGNKHHAVFAYGVEIISGNEGRGIIVRGTLGQGALPESSARGLIQALYFATVAQEINFSMKLRGGGDESSRILAFPHVMGCSDIS